LVFIRKDIDMAYLEWSVGVSPVYEKSLAAESWQKFRVREECSIGSTMAYSDHEQHGERHGVLQPFDGGTCSTRGGPAGEEEAPP
jgi:hypothetical protein